MKTISSLIVVALGVAVLGLSPAHADGCRNSEIAAARAQFQKIVETEKAGKTKEANRAARSFTSDCLNKKEDDELTALIKRTGKILGEQEEKAGRLQEAFDMFEGSRLPADADRVKLKQVRAKSDDIGTVSNAISHFTYRKNDAQVKELRALAAKNADQWLVTEEKLFAATKDSRDALGKAKDWAYHAGTGPQKAQERAEKRGDQLAADTSRRWLELAVAYYKFADKPHKAKGVQDKARQLAEAHARKGESEIAADYYRIAGAGAEADKIEKQGAAKREQAEQRRQQQFKKDQQALEKELGL